SRAGTDLIEAVHMRCGIVCGDNMEENRSPILLEGLTDSTDIIGIILDQEDLGFGHASLFNRSSP
ncbi:MAG: hypothetical protein ACI8RZ_006655, partial [Myxococcota bacterium]